MTSPPFRISPRSANRVRLVSILAVLGPGLVSGFADNDAGGIATFEDTATRTPFDAASARLLKEQLDAVLNSLTGRERRLLRLRFGLADGRPRTVDEVAAELGLSRTTIGQIERDALAKLRHPSRSRKLRAFLD